MYNETGETVGALEASLKTAAELHSKVRVALRTSCLSSVGCMSYSVREKQLVCNSNPRVQDSDSVRVLPTCGPAVSLSVHSRCCMRMCCATVGLPHDCLTCVRRTPTDLLSAEDCGDACVLRANLEDQIAFFPICLALYQKSPDSGERQCRSGT
jgi:hypothetical protein